MGKVSEVDHQSFATYILFPQVGVEEADGQVEAAEVKCETLSCGVLLLNVGVLTGFTQGVRETLKRPNYLHRQHCCSTNKI